MNEKQLIEQYPFFAKIIKWLYKPKKFKSELKTKHWAKFNPDKCINVQKFKDGTVRLNVEINWSDYYNKTLDYFIVDHKPDSWERNYSIHVFFAYARSYLGEAVNIEDTLTEYCQEDALYRIQRCCYTFMD